METLGPWIPYLAALGGLLTGISLSWFALRGNTNTRIARYQERLRSSEKAVADLEAGSANLEAEVRQLRHTEAVSLKRQAELEVLANTQHKAVEEKQQLLRETEIRLANHFKALSVEALRTTQSEFLKLARSSFDSQQREAVSEFEQRRAAVETLVRPVAATLDKVENRIEDLEQARRESATALAEQVRQMAAAQLGLQQETAQLTRALRQPVGRGRWGEIQLKRVVEMAGMLPYCDFIETSAEPSASAPHRPDLIIKLPTGRQIAVDARVPLGAGLEALGAGDEEVRNAALKRHAAQVAGHLIELASAAYRDQFVTAPEFVVLFLPSESFLSAALSEDASLLERGIENGVILATPTTLVALLRAAAVGWRQQDIADKARSVSEVGRELYARVSSLADHVTRVGRALETTVQNYNQAVVALDGEVLPSARRLSDLGAASKTRDLPSPPLIERAVRPSRADLSRLPLPSWDEAPTEPADFSEDSFVGFTESSPRPIPAPTPTAPANPRTVVRTAASAPSAGPGEGEGERTALITGAQAESRPGSRVLPSPPDAEGAAGDLRAALEHQKKAV